MSNYLALATVTVVLRDILLEAARAAVDEAEVTTLRPEAVNDGGQNKSVVNIFLYGVTPNAVWRNADLPTRNAEGGLVKQPQAALDLHYLLSFYGSESELVPQRMLGRAVSALHAQPVLSPDRIRRIVKIIIESGQFEYLSQSNLAEQVERVRFSPLPLNLEELSKLWSVFFQVPYALSVAYQASVVLIEGEDEVPQPALPVLKRGAGDRGWDSFSGGVPQIEQIVPQFVEAGDSITLKGRNLMGDRFTVMFGRHQVTFDPGNPPTLTPAGDLQVRLPDDLPAGIIPVSLRTSRGLASNTAALVLRPQISNLEQGSRTITLKNGTEVEVVTVTFDIKPEVQPGQRGLLLLNERKDDIHDRGPRRAYSITLPRQKGATGSITVDVPQVQPGTYLVRVQIDGAESRLEPPASDTEPYAGPLVTIQRMTD